MRELLELNQVRLDEDLTYEALAAKVGVSHSILHRALHRKTEPRDRTLHKIRRFLDARKVRPGKKVKQAVAS